MTDTTIETRGDREMIITRTFRAPPRIVYDVWTNPEHVKRWWAPASRGAEIVSCVADVRAGGHYRYVTRASEGEFAFSGEYVELTPPSRLVYTQIFEPMADAGAVVVTITFEAVEGGARTRLVSRELYPSKEALEMALSTGMEEGLRETLDQLETLALTLA